MIRQCWGCKHPQTPVLRRRMYGFNRTCPQITGQLGEKGSPTLCVGASPVWRERIVYGVPIRHGHTAIVPIATRPHVAVGERACGARPGGRAAARKPSPGRGGEPSYLSAKPPCTRRESAVITVQRTAPCSPMSRKAAGEPFRRPLAPHSLPRGGSAAGKPFFRRPALASGRPAASGQTPAEHGGEARSAGSRYGRGESVLRTRFVQAMRFSHPRKAWG